MRPLSHPRQRRRENLMPLRLKRLAHALPAPASVPRAVNQNKCAHRSPLSSIENRAHHATLGFLKRL